MATRRGCEDYSDIEEYVRQSGAAPSIERFRPQFPSWHDQLTANGVGRVSVSDTLASDLMIHFIHNAMARKDQDRVAMHHHRNLLWAIRAPMLRERGWKR